MNGTYLEMTEQRLLDSFQHGLPLVPRPFAAIAERLGCREREVIGALQRLMHEGVVTRVGPVFRPHRVGTSTLAAMEVPSARLEEVAALVNRYTEVNHNYEREHRFNLWFVVTAPNEQHLANVLGDIEARTGLPVISLPMLESFHIDLGFPLGNDSPHSVVSDPGRARPVTASERIAKSSVIREPEDLRLVAAIQDGLPLVARPFAEIGATAQLSESEVCRKLEEWLRDGTIGRMGVVVRHRELGFRANAMVVWDVPDDEVREWGRCFSRYDFVTLCYQRERCLPEWRYNLFCMIHGRDREAVEERVRLLVEQCGSPNVPHAVLFSHRRFKQRGARYVIPQTDLIEKEAAGFAHG